MKIVLASRNRNKYKEIKSTADEIGVELLFGGDFDVPCRVEEIGGSYIENSLLKSRAWTKKTGLPSMADDSGLEVRALDGRPGVHSARMVEGSDAARVEWLLSQMKGKTDRSAAFVCCVTVVFPDGREDMACEARCEGRIAESPRGNSGFGYDPIFIPNGYDKTFSELGDEIKLKISHRAKAIKGIAKMLAHVVKSPNVRTKDCIPPVQSIGAFENDDNILEV